MSWGSSWELTYFSLLEIFSRVFAISPCSWSRCVLVVTRESSIPALEEEEEQEQEQEQGQEREEEEEGPVGVHLLEVAPPVPTLHPDGDLQAGGHPLHLQRPQLRVRVALGEVEEGEEEVEEG